MVSGSNGLMELSILVGSESKHKVPLIPALSLSVSVVQSKDVGLNVSVKIVGEQLHRFDDDDVAVVMEDSCICRCLAIAKVSSCRECVVDDSVDSSLLSRLSLGSKCSSTVAVSSFLYLTEAVPVVFFFSLPLLFFLCRSLPALPFM